MEAFLAALALVFDPFVLGVMLLAAVFGLVVGAIPGVTATLATALLIPVTFFMEPTPAIAVIITTVTTAIFAGDIPGALLRIPGTPASAAYSDEAFALTRKGQAELALGVLLTSSVIGGLVGAVLLALFASSLAEVAFKFSSYEYFWLACLGLSTAVVISSGSAVKGLVSLLIGLFIATIGIDLMAGHPRFTFGSAELSGGVSFIPAMIGMFAVSEVLRFVTTTARGRADAPQQPLRRIFAGVAPVLWRYRLNLGRGGLLGAFTGILPGAGSDIAAWISYGVSKEFSAEQRKYGSGHPEGLVDAGASNNAGVAGAWAPALVFGVPGDSITAIVIGVFYMKGMNPGPTVFQQTPELINAVFISFFVANLMLLPLGYVAIRLSRRLLSAPPHTVMPIVLVFCVVGAFAINNSMFGVIVMLVMGLIAYVMEENGFPVAPTILGVVLGDLLEESFLASMIKSDGDFSGFFSRPIAAALGALTLLVWLSPLLRLWFRRRST
ncbi:MAG: tripartite tricarboxylate transporter permease [Neomegalonema sp.]|nr:tripartite tricarboxylate transporter permease [Neomegalonema sp.]